MQIQYVLINFALLAIILFFAGRKTVKRIFGDRLAKINQALDDAEATQDLEMPALESVPPEMPAEPDSEALAMVEEHTQEKIASIKAFGARERSEIHRQMIIKARKDLFSVIKEDVATFFTYEKYAQKIQDLDEQVLDAILADVQLAPGDLTYLQGDTAIYVTLTSAFPLPQRLIDKAEKATAALLETVGGKTSFRTLVEPSLIGGLKLRIGDTVYDGTILEELYHFEKNINHTPIMEDDTVSLLIQEFTQLAENYKPQLHKYQIGRVLTVSDGICWIEGLSNIMYGEVIEFECGDRGMVLDIQHSKVGCVIFGENSHIESGSLVRSVGRIASVPVGECLLGRVVDALGRPIDAMGYLPYTEIRPIEYPAPAILDRAPVTSPLHTGIKAIDALVPIGKGQRELIIGDRQTGKTAIAIDTIINQKGKDTLCIYVAIGQKETLVAEIKEKLQAKGAMDYTVIIAVPASASAALQYIAPFSGTAMAEYFMYKGKDVLIVYDDLSKHAVAYRELSLLLRRPAGREAYPGDIFYLHSRLLERSAHLSEENGGGSITALPIVETLAGDISAYIPTNVISITDGQIFLDADLFNAGQRPAVNVGLSVSRVGGAAQKPVMKKVSASIRTRLAQYRELAEFLQFGSDIDDSTKAALDSGKRLMEILKQGRFTPVADALQTVLIYAVNEGFTKNVDVADMERFEKELYTFLTRKKSAFLLELENAKKLDQPLKESLNSVIAEFVERF